MKFSQYLKSKVLYISLWIFSVVFLGAVLNAHKLPAYSMFYACGVIFVAFAIPFAVEYFRKRSFYNNIEMLLEKLDKKYLITEMLDEPNFFEGDFLCKVLRQTDKSMNDEIAKYRISTEDYKEYIEKWVHDIKTPIAACKLAVENHHNEISAEMCDDLDKIDRYVMQTLFYSRISNVEKDYIIKEKSLNELVALSLRSNSRQLIKNGFSINRHNLDINVLTDEKWISFILDQIIANSITYKSTKPKLTFSGSELDNCVRFDITDNGMGINKADLPRIFEKNFTGGNGRLNKKSTGFGLYLCKKLCAKLGIEITASSENGTTITLLFPLRRI